MSQPFAVVANTTKQAGSVASITTTAMTTQSGDLLVVIITSFTNSIGATPITDNKSNTWVNAIGPIGTTNGFVAIYYAVNCIGGSGHTFTFTPTSSNEIAISVLEVGGAKLSSVLGSTNGAVASSTTHTTGSITSGTTDEIFIGAGAVSAGAEGTPVLNKTLWWLVSALPDGTPEGIIVAFRFVGPSTSDTFSYTVASARNEGVVIAGFKSGSTGSGGERSATFFGL